MSYMDFITDMFHCLGVGSLEDVDYTEDLQKEDIYLDGLLNIVCVYNVSYCLVLTADKVVFIFNLDIFFGYM